jgi:putative DNA primase/helicase
LNWLITGYRLILEVGFDAPPRVLEAVAAYRREADVIGIFLAEYTENADNGRVAANELYPLYAEWAKVNGYKPFSNRTFTMDIHRRYEIRRTGTCGSVIIGLALKK